MSVVPSSHTRGSLSQQRNTYNDPVKIVMNPLARRPRPWEEGSGNIATENIWFSAVADHEGEPPAETD